MLTVSAAAQGSRKMGVIRLRHFLGFFFSSEAMWKRRRTSHTLARLKCLSPKRREEMELSLLLIIQHSKVRRRI